MDSPTPPPDSHAEPVCPWCSAGLSADVAVCPSCGAILTSDEEQDLPGVTAVDAKAALAAARPPSRSRLLSWISGDYPAGAASEAEIKADAQALAPPDPAVQREILRLELEAEVANLQAEADAIRSDAIIEGRLVDSPEGQEDPSEGRDETPASEAETQASEAEAPATEAETQAEDETPAEDQTPSGATPA